MTTVLSLGTSSDAPVEQIPTLAEARKILLQKINDEIIRFLQERNYPVGFDNIKLPSVSNGDLETDKVKNIVGLSEGAKKRIIAQIRKDLEETYTTEKIQQKIQALEAEQTKLREEFAQIPGQIKDLEKFPCHGKPGLIEKRDADKADFQRRAEVIPVVIQDIDQEKGFLMAIKPYSEEERTGIIDTTRTLLEKTLDFQEPEKIKKTPTVRTDSTEDDKSSDTFPVVSKVAHIKQARTLGFRTAAAATFIVGLSSWGAWQLLKKEEPKKSKDNLPAMVSLDSGGNNGYNLPNSDTLILERDAHIVATYTKGEHAVFDQIKNDGDLLSFPKRLETELKRSYGTLVKTIKIEEKRKTLGEPAFEVSLVFRDELKFDRSITSEEIKAPIEAYMTNLLTSDDVREKLHQAIDQFSTPEKMGLLNKAIGTIIFEATSGKIEKKGYMLGFTDSHLERDPETGGQYIQIFYAFDKSTNRTGFRLFLGKRTQIPEVDEWLQGDGVGRLTPEQYEECSQKIQLLKKYPELAKQYAGANIFNFSLLEFAWKNPEEINNLPRIRGQIISDWGKMCSEKKVEIMELYFKGNAVYQKGILELFKQYHPALGSANPEQLWSHMSRDEMSDVLSTLLNTSTSKRPIQADEKLLVNLRVREKGSFCLGEIGNIGEYIDRIMLDACRKIQTFISTRSDGCDIIDTGTDDEIGRFIMSLMNRESKLPVGSPSLEYRSITTTRKDGFIEALTLNISLPDPMGSPMGIPVTFRTNKK